jgi:hypothetical protein
MMAHNLSRELQMRASDRTHHRSPLNRAALWTFEKPGHPAPPTHPPCRPSHATARDRDTVTLTMSANASARDDIERYIPALAT